MKKIMLKANRFLLFALLAILILPLLFFSPAKAYNDFIYSESDDLEWLKDCDDITIVRFCEYGYDDFDYYLELYVYNPQNRSIDFLSRKNYIQMAYTADADSVLKVQYDKYRLIYLDSTENDLFIRFKVASVDKPEDFTRYYCISGLELVSVNSPNATEYGVSSVYKCETIDGNTTISKDVLPTCEVDVHHTFYRTDYSDKNTSSFTGWGNQLSSCYFSLPANFSGYKDEKIESGNLEAVTAEFYNYYSKPVLILGNQTDYSNYYSQVGSNINSDLSFWAERDITSSIAPGGIIPVNFYKYLFSYNINDESDAFNVYSYNKKIDSLYWVLSDFSGQDFSNEDYRFSGDNLREYFNKYSTKYGREKAIVDLFESSSYYTAQNINLCDNTFSYGYNKHTYSIAEKPEEVDDVFGFDLKFDDTGLWNRLWKNWQSETKRVLPLESFNDNHLLLDDKTFSENYLIDIAEVAEFKKFATEEISKGRDVWLFRYDACEYYSHEVDGLENGSGLLTTQSVYLDFDILSFRFNQNGEKYTIANIMSPEDVWNDISGDKEPLSTGDIILDILIRILQYVLYALSGCIVIAVVFKLSKSIIKSDMHIVLKIVLTVLTITIGCALFGVAFFYINKLITYLRSLI